MRRNRLGRLVVLVAVFAIVAAGCGPSESEPLPRDEAEQRLRQLADDIDWQNDPVDAVSPISGGGSGELSETLPDISEYPIVVAPRQGANQTVAEIFVSTEKSGTGQDGWLVEVAEAFNESGTTLSDGSTAQVAIRSIASGTGYQYIASRKYLPAGFSPSNHLWIEMAGTAVPMTPVSDQLVRNVAGMVMKSETASQLRADYGQLDAGTLVEAVIAGDVVMGYTDPFASSTGLNFLLTVLDEFAEGDESRLVAPDVASVFEQFQQHVPFNAPTTLQLRESVERDNGSLDAFVMEYQTFVNTDSLTSGYEFVPFGVAHDNPLYGVGDVSPQEMETLEAFAAFTTAQPAQDQAIEFGFEPPAYEPTVAIPSGETLVAAQQLWKEKKDGGRPVYAVFVTDTSGSMAGTRVAAVKAALTSALDFIGPQTSIGMVEFSDVARKRLDIGEFDLNQQGRFAYAISQMDPIGGTAMYDGIVLGLDMLSEAKAQEPDAKLLLFVLTDGQTTSGLSYGDTAPMIAGLGIPVYTVGFEANVEELARVSSLVESASINASEDDVEYKMAALFNVGT